MNMKKRLFAIALAVLMLVAALPLSASALTSDLTVLINNAEAKGSATVLLEYDTVLYLEDTIPEGLSIIVPEGKTLTVYGKLTVNGSLVVRGYLDNRGTIVNEDKVLVHSGNGEYDSLTTYTCHFCGKQHNIGTTCPVVHHPFGSYYCPICCESHAAGYICYYYNLYYGSPNANGYYYCYSCKNFHANGYNCGVYNPNVNYYFCTYCNLYHSNGYTCSYYYPNMNYYYCHNCEQYHAKGYVCTQVGNHIEYEYCKDCDAYHLKGVECGLLASPTKYEFVEECGHYHKVGETISHPTYGYCANCGYYHYSDAGCVTNPYYKYCYICGKYHAPDQHTHYNYCYTCGKYHADGQHSNYHYCSLCDKYHADGQHSNYGYCYICGRYYSGNHEHNNTHVYCALCCKYHAPNLHAVVKPTVPSYSTSATINFASAAKVTLSDITANLATAGLSTKALGFERTFGDVSTLNAQDFYYIVYATLLNAGEISQVSDESDILSHFYYKNRIANISEYKSAIAYFTSVGVINNYSMNPRQPISTEDAKAALQFAISIAK